ncbi:DinB family protein [Kribbella turkmenica]|uniref:DinB family protein n=1 Tax=Kribbella turkmenica TaxID=2530375 RepID=A0A4R4XAM8_9ACTN|nr:DinB family protein [Kribbella turkmenica]TDD27651.1 DinB family protein [Kribbella turkmenica]
MTEPPPIEQADTITLHLGFLDHYRAVIEAKLTGLSEEELTSSRLPSGWTPLELLKHLVFMERRWLRWGFAAEQVDEPWGDSGGDPDGRWSVGPGETFAELIARLHEGGETTRRLVTGVDPATRAATGGRFSREPPTVNWILFHVLQEYARHAGHLDVVRELTDGVTGE